MVLIYFDGRMQRVACPEITEALQQVLAFVLAENGENRK